MLFRDYMCADIDLKGKTDSRKMEPLKIEKKSGGSWFVSRAKKEKEVQDEKQSEDWEWIKSKDAKEETTRPKPKRRQSVSNLLTRRNTMKEEAPPLPVPPVPVRSNTTPRPSPVRSNTMKRLPQIPVRTDTLDSGVEITSPALQVPDISSLQRESSCTMCTVQSLTTLLRFDKNHRSSSLAVGSMWRTRSAHH